MTGSHEGSRLEARHAAGPGPRCAALGSRGYGCGCGWLRLLARKTARRKAHEMSREMSRGAGWTLVVIGDAVVLVQAGLSPFS